jgi:hypothetical protein
MDERDEVLFEFAVALDVPNEDLIAQYIARYPQYEDDIRYFANELQRMHGEEEVDTPLTEAERKELDASVSRIMFKYYEAIHINSGQKIGNA